MPNFSLAVAFLAGLGSFLSPCVLPIMPGFLAFLAGSSLKESANKRFQVFLASLFFVLGFSVVFSVLGILLNTVLESVAYDVQLWLSRIGGIIIILFGLYLVGLIKPAFLQKEYKIEVKKWSASQHLNSFLFGAAFAAGWTPCVGAFLGGVLGLAATQPGLAFPLLLTYSLGLGLPFLIVGLFASQASALIARYSRFMQYISIFFGIILIILGILAFTQSLSLIANLDFINRLLLPHE